MSTLQGNPIAVLVRTEFGFDSQSGKFVQYVWEGTQDACNGVYNTLTGADNAIQTNIGGGKWQVTARFGNAAVEGGAEEVVREERLRFNIAQKSIFTHPVLTDGLGDYAIKAVRDAIGTNVSDASISAWGAQQQLLYGLAVRGVDSFPVYQPIVVVTDTASRDYPWATEFAYYGYTFSTAGMIQDAYLTSGWKNRLPQDQSNLTGFIYGWLKKPPEVVSVGGNKTQLVQEYEYGLWAEDLLPSSGA